MKRVGISISAIWALLAFFPQQGNVTLRLLPPEFSYEARGGGGDFGETYELSYMVVDGDLRPLSVYLREGREEFEKWLRSRGRADADRRAGR